MDSSHAPQSPATPPPGEDLGLVDALTQLSFLVQQALGEVAGEFELSIIQTRLLGILSDREPTMNELAGYLSLDKSSITGLVSRAEKRDLVRRSVSTSDRRSFQVSITETGRQLASQIHATFTGRIEALVAGLPDGDRRRLSHLATQVLAADADRRGLDLFPRGGVPSART
ncbi:DNA-binding MarR family transcriptional regulator [Catenulispora sp. EB89]|uniref:MarR family winged helix-turn-helix transcriptional regulator n=1 Tax=Catenulispora sp. EB89 TaxID=3156257 RepID=UPI003514C369